MANFPSNTQVYEYSLNIKPHPNCMQNSELAEKLSLYGKLLELHGENEFKTRSYLQAPYAIKKLDTELSSLSIDSVLNIPTLNTSLKKKIAVLIQTGSFPELDDLLSKTPEGVIQLLDVRGLGPKKVRLLWKELHITDPGELLYACRENRLKEFKGFGTATQEKLIQELEFKAMNSNKVLYAQMVQKAQDLLQAFVASADIKRMEITGDLRRQCEVISRLEYVVQCSKISVMEQILSGMGLSHEVSECQTFMRAQTFEGFPIDFYLASQEAFEAILMRTTGSAKHLDQLTHFPPTIGYTEEEVYNKNGYHWIMPAMREGYLEFETVGKSGDASVIQYADIRGSIHNHSTWSDGNNSIEEMARFCIQEGWEYLVMCDHSQTAFYAGGLKPEQIALQNQEIQKLNVSLKPFRVFQGIESDILADGSLDYEPDVLKNLDLVVASVHSRLDMDPQTATQRLLKAIENPYTRILGHLTGRLLLSRKGYEPNMKKILEACIANGVVVELNANPHRLDIDWRHLVGMAEQGLMISINPDAHSDQGLKHTLYGVLMAQKVGFPKSQVLNTMNLNEFTSFLDQKR